MAPSQIETCLRSCFWLVESQTVPSSGLWQQEEGIATCGAFGSLSATRSNLLSCGELEVLEVSTPFCLPQILEFVTEKCLFEPRAQCCRVHSSNRRLSVFPNISPWFISTWLIHPKSLAKNPKFSSFPQVEYVNPKPLRGTIFTTVY